MSPHSWRRPIISAKNPRFRSALALRERKGRLQQGRFLIDGIREITRAMGQPVSILEVYVCKELVEAAGAQSLLGALESRRVPQFELPRSLWSRLAFGDRTDGIVAVAANRAPAGQELDLGACPLVIVLEHVEKPGNVGAVFRTADAVGARCVVLADGNQDVFNPNIIRASLGTIFCLPHLHMNSYEAMEWLIANRVHVQVARTDAARSCFDLDFRGPTAIVLGSEARGVSPVWRANNLTSFHVPMCGHADSLNVSVTAAVVLYEAYRQRSSKPSAP